MGVSALTERKLREAMARLLAGQPLRTDGALTKENLAREAGVSHASVHRATDVLLFALAHPRWEFVCQPTYAAYLNLIEARPTECRNTAQW